MSEFTNRVNWITTVLLVMMKRLYLSNQRNHWLRKFVLERFIHSCRDEFSREFGVSETLAAVRFHRWAKEQQEAKRIKSWLENDDGQEKC